jgi:hypothetical protein
MKYTRYDLNKKKNNFSSFLVAIVGVIIISTLLGTILSKVFMPSIDSQVENSTINEGVVLEDESSSESDEAQQPVIKSIDESNGTDGDTAVEDTSSEGNSDGMFKILQCGAFGDQANADKLKEQLAGFGVAFVVTENDINKVVLGVYKKTTLDVITAKLASANIECSSHSINFSKENSCDNQISLILDASLNLISEIEQNGATSVKTESMKQWIDSLSEIDGNEINYANLIELKTYCKNLPETISKEDIATIKEYIYNYIIKVKNAI